MTDIKINATKLVVEDILEVSNATKGGILIPTTVRRNNMKGKIIFKGEGLPDVPMVHNIGDTALYHPSAGQKFPYGEAELRLIDINEVFLSGRE